MTKINIVTTTVTENPYLTEYYNNIFTHNKLETFQIRFIVVGDNKTPPSVRETCNELNYIAMENKHNVSFDYWSPKAQNAWLDNIHVPDTRKKTIVPENSPRRRNFGYLWSLSDNADYMIVVDDDNYPLQNINWLGEHLSDICTVAVKSKNDIVNPCEPCIVGKPFHYARGYPKKQYFKDSFEAFDIALDDMENIVINTSIWQEDPDVDAQLLLYTDRLTSIGFDRQSKYLTWGRAYIPINSQNTLVKKEIAPLYWNVHMPKGMDRYDDIWGGLFATKCAKEYNKKVSFGMPYVAHKRNTHDYLKDYKQEYLAEIINSTMWEEIIQFNNMSCGNYLNMYQDIAEYLSTSHWYTHPMMNDMVREIGHSMYAWISVVEQVI